jgi:hypothetical protein
LKKTTAAIESNHKIEIDVTTRNYFAPLRVTSMDTDTAGAETTTLEKETSGKAGRPHNKFNVHSEPLPVTKANKYCGQRRL